MKVMMIVLMRVKRLIGGKGNPVGRRGGGNLKRSLIMKVGVVMMIVKIIINRRKGRNREGRVRGKSRREDSN